MIHNIELPSPRQEEEMHQPTVMSASQGARAAVILVKTHKRRNTQLGRSRRRVLQGFTGKYLVITMTA